MRNLKNNLIDIIFLSLLGLLLLFLVIPWPFPRIEVKSSQDAFKAKVEFADETKTGKNVSLNKCAFLFGVRPAPSGGSEKLSAQAEPIKTGPEKVPWLKYIGLIAEPDGEQIYYFKDTRSSRVLKLSLGQTAQGWKLTGITASHFTLKNEGKMYAVEK